MVQFDGMYLVGGGPAAGTRLLRSEYLFVALQGEEISQAIERS